MRYWLDMGASGFRVDTASSLVKNDKNWEATCTFWQDIRQMLDKEYPDAVLVSEWSCPVTAVKKAGFHVDFILDFADADNRSLFRLEKERDIFGRGDGHSFFCKTGKGDISKFLQQFLENHTKIKNFGYISLPSGSHNVSRIGMKRNQKELEVIFAFLMTIPTIPCIYYGDEIGMKYISGLASKEGAYSRTGSRTPMQWNTKKNAGFSQAVENKLYLPIKKPYDLNVENQQANPNSLLNKVRQLINFRKLSPALQPDGKFEIINAASNGYPFLYTREKDNEKFLIALNPSDCTQEAILDSRKNISLKFGYGVKIFETENGYRLHMPPISYGIFKM